MNQITNLIPRKTQKTLLFYIEINNYVELIGHVDFVFL